ncbi:unnamed protein product [Protopolystoma xenopodis]|uniref:Uncharacterized protein n=1 Tax=Protopolystoma xenopodis TaxID=117903 RepID=A0A3S5CHL9_9PLAT|nr:unnamed protein product [Protopolystoma xenopodis]
MTYPPSGVELKAVTDCGIGVGETIGRAVIGNMQVFGCDCRVDSQPMHDLLEFLQIWLLDCLQLFVHPSIKVRCLTKP